MIASTELMRICFLMVFSSLIFLPTSHTQCNTTIPDNSIVILDSNTYHTDSNRVIQAEEIPGWFIGFNNDGIEYTVSAGGVTIDDTLQWRVPHLLTGACGPEYVACFKTDLVSNESVNTNRERNWLLSSYYETEANTIHIRVTCTALSNYEQDCRRTFQLFYYESDTNWTLSETIVQSITSQSLPADNYTDQLTDENVVLATFTKSKKGFYIGFLNSIPCADLTEILFYYFQCPAVESVSGVYSVSAVLSPSPTDVSVSVNVLCVILNKYTVSLSAKCYLNGTWRLPAESVCECMAGSYLPADSSSLSCVPCPVNSYRARSGDAMQECTQCPSRSNTLGTEGAVECSCETDWYRGEGESVSEPCGQSPSAVRNVRVERGTADLTAEWDEPEYLGTRDFSELRYKLSYYRTISPQMETVVQLMERQLTVNVSESTEYTIVVTSLNSVSSVSGVYNRANLTVLSSLPDISSIRYYETSYSLEWSYSLYGEREYVFELSYTSVDSSETVLLQVSSSECECTAVYTCVCTVSVRDLNTTQKDIIFKLFYEDSGDLVYTNLSYTTMYSLESTNSPTSCAESSIFTILLVLTGVSCSLFLIPITVIGVIFFLLWSVK